MTATLTDPRSALDARGGADLYRFRLAGSLSRTVQDVTTLAKESDGSVVIPDVDVLKVGTFNGLQLVDGDLDAMVERFYSLRESGIFLPPFRLDHSWSVLSVIGYFDDLSTYVRVDETDGTSKLFLRADVRITGSVDYSVDQILSAIKRGSLRSRSSELGYYYTNSGIELPLIFYGAAFVDIPAVEGLAPVKLSKPAPEPHSIVNLNAEGSAVSTTPVEDEAAARAAAAAAVAAADPPPADDPAGDPAPDPVPDSEGTTPPADPDPEPTGDPDPVPADPPPTPPAGTDPQAFAAAVAELEAARADLAKLRADRVATDLGAFQRDGKVVPVTLAAARTLLSHDDDVVRDAARQILSNAPSAVTLGAKHGKKTLSADLSVAGDGSKTIQLGMEPDEVGALWASFSTDERRNRQAEYDAWRLDYYGSE